MKIPVELKHKPVIVSENYNLIDGRYAEASDAKGLSLGLAQWNERGKLAISAKVWRHTGEKWSRQSEELPLHRVIDLSILICQAKLYFSNLYHTKKKDSKEYPEIKKIALQGGGMNINVCTDNPHIDEDVKLFESCLNQDDEIISERLRRLSSLLKELGY